MKAFSKIERANQCLAKWIGRFSGSDTQTSDVYNWFAPQADILVMFCRDLICRAEHKNRVLDRPIYLVAFRLCRLVSKIFEDVKRHRNSIGKYIFKLDLIESEKLRRLRDRQCK